MGRMNSRTRTLRRVVVAALAVLLFGALVPMGAHADTKKELEKAKKELDALVVKINQEKDDLADLEAQLNAAQAELNASAVAIDGAQSKT